MRNSTLKKRFRKLLNSSGDHEIYKRWSELLERMNSSEFSIDLLKTISGNKSALKRSKNVLKAFSKEFDEISLLLNERVQELYSMKNSKSSSQEIDNVEYIIKKYGDEISFELLEKIINDDEF